MDDTLDASHICEDTVLTKGVFHLLHVFHIEFYWCAEENVIAVAETLVLNIAYTVYDITADCFCQSFSVCVKSQQMVIRMKFSDGFGNGTANESQADKTYGFHITSEAFQVTFIL